MEKSKSLFVINPVSGSGKGLAVFEKMAPFFAKSNITKVVSERAGHIYEVANYTDFSDLKSIIIIGGDGTLHEFINGMMDRTDGLKLPLGLIPAGTGNSLMHDLEVLDPEKAVENVLAGKTFKMDLAKVSYEDKHVYAFNVVGWGIPSVINQKAEKLKFFGGQRYNVASLMEIIRNPTWPLKLRVGNELIEGDYSFFMACNTIHTGKGMKIAPDASLSDGLFDLILLKKASRLKLIKLFSQIFKGDHINHPIVVHEQASHFAISEAKPSVLIVDGQIIGKTPFKAEVLKEAIEVFG